MNDSEKSTEETNDESNKKKSLIFVIVGVVFLFIAGTGFAYNVGLNTNLSVRVVEATAKEVRATQVLQQKALVAHTASGKPGFIAAQIDKITKGENTLRYLAANYPSCMMLSVSTSGARGHKSEGVEETVYFAKSADCPG